MKNFVYVGLLAILLAGCSKPVNNTIDKGVTDTEVNPFVDEKPESFTVAWSEYPSWSIFGVASDVGIIDGRQGYLGEVEKKWHIDIVLKQADYDPCLLMFSQGSVDAACLTNIDTIPNCLGRPAVAILPTSTSDGGDMCIVQKDVDLESLKTKTTYGLEQSVSQYVFERVLTVNGKNPSDYKFSALDPAAAAQAMQGNQKDIESIMVWNPYGLTTERSRKDVKRLFDSSAIKEEVIDCVMMGQDSLKKPGADRFAAAIIETFYRMNERLADSAKGDETIVAIGAKFSSLGLDDMKLVLTQTKFYKDADAGKQLFKSKVFQEETMPGVVRYWKKNKKVDENIPENKFGFDESNKPFLYFTTKYIDMVKNGPGVPAK